MTRNVQVVLTEEETKFVLGALDRVPIQGVAAARLVTAVSEKLSAAARFAYERPERVRAPIDQAILARVTPLPRVEIDPLPGAKTITPAPAPESNGETK